MDFREGEVDSLVKIDTAVVSFLHFQVNTVMTSGHDILAVQDTRIQHPECLVTLVHTVQDYADTAYMLSLIHISQASLATVLRLISLETFRYLSNLMSISPI